VAVRNRLAVDIVNAVHAPLAPARLRAVLRRAASLPEVAARLPDHRVTVAVRVAGDDELRRLHRDYMGEDSVTDVLSFVGDGDQLGDLAVSWPAVVRQAKRFRHEPSDELALLCVHGLLHLLGWDHIHRAEAMEMGRLQKAALALSGIDAPGRL
jgi:probable rRNA maturation factor